MLPTERESNPEIDKINKTLEVRNFSYTYSLSPCSVLEEVSFDVEKGETIGIAGESGSGKTTLLYAISGLIPHFFRDGEYKGEILFKGKPVKDCDIRQIINHFGMVFQDPASQLFGMKVDDAIAFGMENQNVPQEEMQRRIREIAAKLSIEHLLDRKSLSLSGGEQQRASIATALAKQADVLLFDEALSALDPVGQANVKEIIAKLRGESKQTIIIVDSDFNWLAENVDKVIVLKEGKVIYQGVSSKVYEDEELVRAVGAVNNIGKRVFREDECLQSSLACEVKNVTFSYGDKTALENVSLDIYQGSCTAFVGPNGSGKTTMAKILAGIFKAQKGRAMVHGQEIGLMPAKLAVKHVGYLFQNPSRMFLNANIREDLNVTPNILGEKLAVNLEELGIELDSEKSPWELPSGQQQRLALAEALSAGSRVVLLDEPTLGQTMQDRNNLVEIVKKLQKKGISVVVISHDLDFVAKISQYTYYFNSGHIKTAGPTKKVFEELNLC